MNQILLFDLIAGLLLLSSLVGFHFSTRMLFIPLIEFDRQNWLSLVRQSIRDNHHSVLSVLILIPFVHLALSTICVLGRSLLSENVGLTSVLPIAITPGIILLTFYSGLNYVAPGANNSSWFYPNLLPFCFVNSLILVTGGCIGWALSKVI
jgi:arginine exporter protein ArgO